MKTTEPPRLIIWDLDDTFWRGTLAEEGIIAFIPENHEIVRELTSRGIMNSICSKNDLASASRVLKDLSLWDYFIFPSIDWTPKAPRIKKIIESTQLRSSTVLFIDDNRRNLAEASEMNPGLQTATPEVLAELLSLPTFQGKADPSHSRLKQYKVMESRAHDYEHSRGGVQEFLRLSDIRVQFDYDVESNLDRAIELISRTNQLNFTKNRLSSDLESARSELRSDLRRYNCQSALVSVRDKYGDYGIVGFYLTHGGYPNLELKHFCFSCRTLGMGIERWIYDWLGRPSLCVKMPVSIDINSEPSSDWVTIDPPVSAPAHRAGTPEAGAMEVRLRGACEMDAILHYVRGSARSVSIENGRIAHGVHFPTNSVFNLLLGEPATLAKSAVRLAQIGIDTSIFETNFFCQPHSDCTLVFANWFDVYGYHYRERGGDLEFTCYLPNGPSDLTKISEESLCDYLERSSLNPSDREWTARLILGLKDRFDFVPTSIELMASRLARLLSLSPAGSNTLVLLPPALVCRERTLEVSPTVAAFNQAVDAIVGTLAGGRTVDFGREIKNPEDFDDEWSHFSRMVYFRVSGAINSLLNNGAI